MTLKEKSYKEKEMEKRRGKRRYLERIAEEEEADKDIKNYQQEDKPNYPEPEEH
jgi:hypothetical protein